MSIDSFWTPHFPLQGKDFTSCFSAISNIYFKSGFFLTPAAEKTKTQGKNSSQKLKEKTQPLGGFSLQLGKLKKKMNFPIKTNFF